MIIGLMLIALVVSQMPEKEESKPKFIDFLPEPRRKKRTYKRESLLDKFNDSTT